jgi:DNA replication protein DnaC
VALTNMQYDSMIRLYESRQNKNRHILDQRFQEIYDKIPEYLVVDQQISSISVLQGKKLLMGDETALTELKGILFDLKDQKKQLLIAAGYPVDYLEPIYDCNLCQDKGYVEEKKCICFKQQMISLLYEQSNIQNLLEIENFKTLKYDYYQGDDLKYFENAVKQCKNFVENYNNDYHNLFFYGTVGTGKSFLSNCVAKELLDKGHSVLYFSACQLFDQISKYSFDYKEKDELSQIYDDIYNCDLLIIDDLGTELTNNFVASQLFSCLNERHIRKHGTIISTNLSLEELRNRYSDRIFSRITSNYQLCKLSGSDIRIQKKRLMNRK